MSGDRANREKAGWHVDKTINLALVGVFLAQSATAVWFASSKSAVLDQHESKIQKLEIDIRRQDDKTADVAGRLIRLEERTTIILDTVKEIKDGMQRPARP